MSREEGCASCLRKYLDMPYENTIYNIGRRDEALIEQIRDSFTIYTVLAALKLVKERP